MGYFDGFFKIICKNKISLYYIGFVDLTVLLKNYSSEWVYFESLDYKKLSFTIRGYCPGNKIKSIKRVILQFLHTKGRICYFK